MPYQRFNPRLTSEARQTSGRSSGRGGSGVSIRASLQQRGERGRAPHVGGYYSVSIRASLQQRGEQTRLLLMHQPAGFQSAPHFSSEANANFGTTLKDEAGVSIRASLQQRGEPVGLGGESCRRCRFNPRLTSAARRT